MVCHGSQDDAAPMLNVSRRSVRAAAKVLHDDAPELVGAVERSDVTVSAAAAIATLPQAQHQEVVAGAAPGYSSTKVT